MVKDIVNRVEVGETAVEVNNVELGCSTGEVPGMTEVDVSNIELD